MRTRYITETRQRTYDAILAELRRPNRLSYQDIAISVGISMPTVINVARKNGLLNKQLITAALGQGVAGDN